MFLYISTFFPSLLSTLSTHTHTGSTTDKKSKKSNRFPANGSRCQAVVLSEEINTPEEEEKILGPRHKVLTDFKSNY